MSKNTELKADLDRIGYELGGAHLTRQARSATFNTFAQVMRQLGQVIRCAKQIGGRHLKAFVQERAAQGLAPAPAPTNWKTISFDICPRRNRLFLHWPGNAEAEIFMLDAKRAFCPPLIFSAVGSHL